MKEKWERLNKISLWAKKHTFLAVCAFSILVCVLICIAFLVNYLCQAEALATEVSAEKDGYTVAHFSDSAFETAIRQYIGSPEGDIYLEDLDVIQTLTLTDLHQLKDLSDIKLFPNLNTLTISNCAVYDISAVETLKYLEIVNLSKNRIYDISPLCELERLQKLDLSNNNIAQIPEEIGQLEMLIDLNLAGNRISTVDPVLGNENLQTLNLRWNRLTELPDLSTMKALKVANFSLNTISQITSLAGMPSIETFNVEGNLLEDVDFLRDQKHVINIDISFNNIDDISVLVTCSNLESLTLYGVDDFDLSPLEQIPSFNSIYLDVCFNREGNIDFLLDHFKAGDQTTLHYIVSRNNMIEEQ